MTEQEYQPKLLDALTRIGVQIANANPAPQVANVAIALETTAHELSKMNKMLEKIYDTLPKK